MYICLTFLVTMYYQPFDEDAQPIYGISQMAIALQDPSGLKLHTWNVGQTQKQINSYDSLNLFQTGEEAMIHKSNYSVSTTDEKTELNSAVTAEQTYGKIRNIANTVYRIAY